MQVPKQTKRSLPTLTEVVLPYVAPAASAVDPEELIESLLQRVAPAVEQQLREILQRQLQEQMRLLLPQMQSEMEMLVRQLVAQGIAEKGLIGT